MTIERIQLQGLRNRTLEAKPKKNWKDGVTPTKDSDISARARAFKGMLQDATFHTMRLESSDGLLEEQEASQEALRAIRDDIVKGGHSLMVFDILVTDNVALERKKAQEEAEDAELIEKTFSKQQVFRNEIPIVNFGNHAFKK